jgi:hypothetical protein
MDAAASSGPIDSPAPADPRVADPAHLLALFEQLIPTDALNDFDAGHACLFNSWLVTWLMVWQRAQGHASLAQAAAEVLVGPTADHLPDCKRVRERDLSPNTSAYSQARSRLPREAAIRVADTVFATLTADLPPAWKGRPAYLIDGSSLTLTHQPELVEQFPPAVNQHGASHWPVVRFVVAHELSTGLSPRWEWGPMYGPRATSETALARAVLRRLPAASVVIDDRNFGILAMVHDAVAAGHDVLVRMTEKRFRAVTKGMTPTGPGEWAGVWRPTRWDLRNNPGLAADAAVRGRFVERRLGRDGEEVVLLLFTTLMGETPEELATLYGRRWDIESDIKDIKQTLEMHALSGRSVDTVEKEMILGGVAYNLTLMVRRMAAERAGVPPRDLSFTRTLALVTAFARGVGSGDPERQRDRFERLLKAVAKCRLHRRKGRDRPRDLIPRRRGYPERKRTQVVDKKS